MRIKYDPEVDVIRITLKDVDIEESDEDAPGIILDFDANRNVVGGAFYGWGEAIFNPFQWVFDTSPQFIRGRVGMQNYCAERLAE